MKFIFNMMKGEREESVEGSPPAMLALPAPPPPRVFIPPMELETSETMTPFGIPMKSEQESETEE